MFKPTDKMFSKVLRTIFYRINKQEIPFKPSFQKTIAIPEGMFFRKPEEVPAGMFFRKPEEVPEGMFFRKPEGMFFRKPEELLAGMFIKNEPWINQFSMVNICSDLID